MKTLILLILMLPAFASAQVKNNDDVYFSTHPIANKLPSYQKGLSDAQKNYKFYKSAATTTFIVSILSPILGLAPAIGGTSGTPNIITPLNYDLLKNPDYNKGYEYQAKKLRSKKVWNNWLIGTGINIAASIITYKIITGSKNNETPFIPKYRGF